MGVGDELPGRELIPCPAAEYPARPVLADPAHPDGIGMGEHFHPVPALAAPADDHYACSSPGGSETCGG